MTTQWLAGPRLQAALEELVARRIEEERSRCIALVERWHPNEGPHEHPLVVEIRSGMRAEEWEDSMIRVTERMIAAGRKATRVEDDCPPDELMARIYRAMRATEQFGSMACTRCGGDGVEPEEMLGGS